MTAPYVCSRCCRRIAHRAVCNDIGRQQQRLASSSSSSHTLDNLVAELPQSSRYSRRPSPRPRPSNDGAPSEPTHGGSFLDYLASATATRPIGGGVGRYSRQPGQDLQPPVQAQQLPVKASRAYVSELDELLTHGDAIKAWSFFQQEFQSRDSPALARPAFIDVAKHSRGKPYKKLLALLLDRWLEQTLHLSNPASPSLPSPVEVLRRYDDLGISAPIMYQTTVWSIATTLELTAPNGIDPTQATTISVLAQLLHLLPRGLYFKSNQSDSKDSEFYLTRQLTIDNLKDGVASGLLIYDLLRDCSSLPAELAQYTSLVDTIKRVVGNKALSEPQLQSMKHKLKSTRLPSDAMDNILERLFNRPVTSTMQENGLNNTSRPITSTMQESGRNPTPSRVGNLPSSVGEYLKLIYSIVERQNLDSLEKLWVDAMQNSLDEHFKVPKNSPSMQRVYEAFLVAFFDLRRPQEGLQVWNSMLQSGHEPTVRTWNIIMKACHISRDIDIMESLWQRMRESGLQPDAVSWGTRIYGLFRIGTVQSGMRALDQVGREWLAVEQQRQKQATTDLPEVVKPNTAILNSAISALRGKKSQYIQRVLAWGRSFNIEPDVITYNALLHIALSHGEADEATKILQRMSATNIKPDSATFTVLATSLVHSSLLKDLSTSEQEQKIMDIIDSFEQYGLRIDQQGYALLIDRMLKEYNNPGAAQKIIAHMHSRQIKPTPHIYTILMTSYFDSDPPDLAAADALWSEIQKRAEKSGPGLDVIFYDRMMEGYAKHGNVGQTKTFLYKMSREGKRPGWLALAAVVKCLAQKNDWDMLHQVVFDCHREEGLFQVGMRGRKGQKQFWSLVGDIAVELYDTQVGKDMLAIVDAQREAASGWS